MEKGVTTTGFPAELRAPAHVATLIDRLARIGCHPGHVWRVLRGLGWIRLRDRRPIGAMAADLADSAPDLVEAVRLPLPNAAPALTVGADRIHGATTGR